ncbi:MAG: site-2 protease family protein [Clostridia bacterium]|nr:site-2 protease family protein [Clostridia bacterium]
MLSSLFSGNIQQFLMEFLLSLPIVFLALSVHETAHGYVAYKLGDPTAHSLGRLTLNPIKHIDPFGFLCMLFFGYGWAKPVPINTRYFKKPKRDMALTALAGPLSNILLAIVFALLMRAELAIWEAVQPESFTLFWYTLALPSEFSGLCFYWLFQFMIIGVSLNVSLAVFNLIPVPPFDGSRIFLSMLPSKIYFRIMQYERYIYIVFMIVLVMGFLDTPIAFVTDFFIDLVLRTVF